MIRINACADYAKATDNRCSANANVGLSGNVIKVQPTSILCRYDSLGTKHHSVRGIFRKRLKNRKKPFFGVLMRGFSTPALEYFVCMMVIVTASTMLTMLMMVMSTLTFFIMIMMVVMSTLALFIMIVMVVMSALAFFVMIVMVVMSALALFVMIMVVVMSTLALFVMIMVVVMSALAMLLMIMVLLFQSGNSSI